MALIARLNVMLTATTKNFVTGMQRAQRRVNRFKRSMRPLTAIAGTAIRALQRVGIAAIALGAAFAYLVKTTANTVDAQGKLSRRLGISFRDFKSFELAASLAGVSSEQLNKALEKMSDTLGAAAFGEGEAVRAFKNIGLSVQALLAMNPAQQFRAIGEAIARLPDPAQRTAAARDIFGRSGASLITLFNAGGQAIDQATVRVQQFGLALSDMDVSGIEAMNDSLTVVKSIFEGIRTQLAVAVSPLVTQLATDFENWIISLGGVPTIMENIGIAAGNVLDTVSRWTDKLIATWETLKGLWDRVPEWVKKGGPIGATARFLLDAPELPGGGIRTRINNRAEELRQERGGGYADKFRNYFAGARERGARAAQDAANAPAVEDARRTRAAQLRYNFEQRQAQIMMEQQRKTEILRQRAAANPKFFSPGARQALNQPTPYEQQILEYMRQTAMNTGQGRIAYAN